MMKVTREISRIKAIRGISMIKAIRGILMIKKPATNSTYFFS